MNAYAHHRKVKKAFWGSNSYTCIITGHRFNMLNTFLQYHTVIFQARPISHLHLTITHHPEVHPRKNQEQHDREEQVLEGVVLQAVRFILDPIIQLPIRIRHMLVIFQYLLLQLLHAATTRTPTPGARYYTNNNKKGRPKTTAFSSQLLYLNRKPYLSCR